MSTPRNAVTPSLAWSGPASIRALNAASCSGVSSRGRAAALGPVAQAVHPFAAVAPEPGVKCRAADAARPRRRLDRHPAEHVGHAEPAHPGARVRLAPGAPPQLRRAPRVDFDDPHRSHPR